MQFNQKENVIPCLLKKTYADSASWSLSNFDLQGEGKTKSIAFLNAHAINTACENRDFYNFLCQSSYLLRDGIGIKIALKFFGYAPTENLNGTDLIPCLLSKYKDKKIAIFGASDLALEACKKRLYRDGISQIVSMAHGFFDIEHYVRLCQETHPEIVVLCMGMPKQEIIATVLQANGLCKLVICGGGWADFYSETKKRAPLWIRKLSLEWLFRLLSEPKRLGNRYTIGILIFFYLILKALAKYFKERK